MNWEQSARAMLSLDYKERFVAEYVQLKERTENLRDMLTLCDKDELYFTPTCSRALLGQQLSTMETYLRILEERGKIEGIDLS